MIINNINITAFGKLKDIHIDFTNGLNVIYGDIESGQATIIQFIKMMFYGASAIDENSDILNNERLKYRPLDGFDNPMGGSIEFSFNDISYRIERVFNNSNENDIITLYNTTDNIQLDTAGETSLGKIFFGMNKDFLERSIFIDEFNAPSIDDNSAQKLLNIISSYAEDVSADMVKSRLNTAKETYLSKSGKIGILDKNKETISSLYEDIKSAQDEESKKIQMQIEYEAVQDNRDEIIARYDELRRTLTIQQTMTEVNTLKNTVAKLDNLNSLNEEISNREKALTNENVIVNEEFIKNSIQKMNSIQQIGEMKNQYQSMVHRVKSELDSMTEHLNTAYEEEHRLYDEAKEQIEFTNGHINNLNKAINDKKQQMVELSEKIKDADVNFRVIDEQVKSKKQLDQQRLDIAQQQLEDARQPIVYSNPTSLSSFKMLAVIICVLGILLTLTINLWCMLVIGMGLIMTLITFFDKNNTSKKGAAKYQRIDEVAVSKANENIQKVRHDIEIEQYSLNKKQREAKKQLNMLKLNEEQLVAEVEKYQDQIKILQKNLEYWNTQKNDTEAIFSEEQSKVDLKQKELNTIFENISNSEENLYNAQNDVLKYVSQFKTCSTLTEVTSLINSLNSELENIKNLKNKADYQAEVLKSETNGQSYEVLKEKLTDITADFIEMCGKENPEPMSISELSKLKAEIDDCQFSLNMQNADLSYINTDIKSKFRNRTCVTEIEHDINHIEREIVKQEKFCHSLDLANEALQQSIDEIKGYNVTLNEMTSNIFNQIIDESYESLAITQTLNLATQYDDSINSWKYLTKGTIEQAYLSLRLGVSQMVSNTYFDEPLPILLNDAFIQHNQEKMSKDIEFLNNYSNYCQLVVFTCNKNIYDTIQEKNTSAKLVELV